MTQIRLNLLASDKFLAERPRSTLGLRWHLVVRIVQYLAFGYFSLLPVWLVCPGLNAQDDILVEEGPIIDQTPFDLIRLNQ